MPTAVLTHVGNYELIRPLGAGGMAQTFVAKRRGPAGFEQTVCLKRILPEHALDQLLVEQFLDEARLLAHLRHANVVQVYDFGEADGAYFMALELIDGVDLDGLLRHLATRRQPLPAAIALHVVAETLKALNYAHHAELDGEPLHLVHRDISPANILLSRAGEVKLADFGIAKSRHRRHKTKAGYTKGKVAYMSPEQVRGEELDARSDLFAVGILLHELLAGVHPFDADTDITVLGNILHGKRPELSGWSPPMREEWVRLIDALLATDRAERPDTAADALALLPALETPFRIERQLAELVTACIAARPVRASAPRAPEIPEGPHGTAPLPTRPQDRPQLRTNAESAAPSHSPARRYGITADVPSATTEFVSTDALMAAQVGRRRGIRVALVALAVGVAVGASWLAIRAAGPESKPAFVEPVLPHVPNPDHPLDRVGTDSATAEPVTQPAAPRPTEAAEQDLEADEASDTGSRAPLILHAAPTDDDPRAKPPRAPKRERSQTSREAPREKTSREAPREKALPEVPRQTTALPSTPQPLHEPESSPATPPAAAAEQPKSKHRTGSNFQANEF